MVCLRRTYHFKFFKGCLPQILLGPFLNTLSQMSLNAYLKIRLQSGSIMKRITVNGKEVSFTFN